MKGIKYISYLDNTGYGIAARMLLIALHERGIPLTWYPMIRNSHGYQPIHAAGIQSGDSRLNGLYHRDIEYDTVIIHTIPQYYHLVIQEERPKGKRVIGHLVWETSKLPDTWVQQINELDATIVPSTWNQDVFLHSGIRIPIQVVPHLPEFSDNCQAEGADPLFVDVDPNTFIFYAIAEWNDRKQVPQLIETYLHAFKGRSNVCLFIKTSKLNYLALQRSWRTAFRLRFQPTSPVIKRYLKNKMDTPGLVIINQELERQKIFRLHQRGDCYVSLSRSEGWGMGAYEAAWQGKPVITTGFGGQLDYLPQELSFHINYHVCDIITPAGWPEYQSDQQWAAPDLVHAAKIMMEVNQNAAAAKTKGLLLKEFIRRNFDSQAILDRLIHFLKQLK